MKTIGLFDVLLYVMILVVISLIDVQLVSSSPAGRVRFNIPNGSGAQALRDQITLAQNMCFVGLRGVNCGGSSKSVANLLKAGNGGNEWLVAGNGYDRWTHEVKPQVIQSKQVTALAQVKESSAFVGMSSARDFYSQLYPVNGQSTFYNGLYSHNGGADEIFSKFFQGSFNVYDSQKQYITHQVNSYDSLNTTFIFRRIIDILPENMDAGLYQQVIDSFGDSVMTEVEYGGVVDSTVSVRQCFSDGNMESYVTNELNSVITGSTANVPDGYARYHKVSQLDIVGGNPEISSVGQRVSTFASNPVPVKFLTIPIWMVFPEGAKRNNMKQIYDQYVSSKSNMANTLVQELENRKNDEQRQPKVFRAFFRNKQGVLQDVGQYTLSLGQRLDIAQLDWLLIYMATSKSPIFAWQGKSTATIIRHEDSSFHLELYQYHPEVESHQINIPRVLSSATVLNACSSLVFPVATPTTKVFSYTQWSEMIVCSGGQIMLAGDQRSVLFGCPYVY